MLESVDVTVAAEGRDKGKVFRITPMAAWRAEKWGWRAVSVLARSGVEVPPLEAMSNLLVLAAFGLEALMKAPFEEAEPLLDEMMTCVAAVPDPSNFPTVARPLVESDTQELGTILWLRDKVLEAHTGFSVAAVLSNLKAQAAALNMSHASTPTSPPNTSE